jgi:hypothetical protein
LAYLSLIRRSISGFLAPATILNIY